jgi:hypothetical protein
MEKQLGTDPSQVGVLSIDLGTSCHVGATVSLPPGQAPATLSRPYGKKGDEKKKTTRRGRRRPGERNRQRAKPKARKLTKQPQYFDIVVKREAVSRPSAALPIDSKTGRRTPLEPLPGGPSRISRLPCRRSRVKTPRFASTLQRVELRKTIYTTSTATPTSGSMNGTPKCVVRRNSTRSPRAF